MTPWLAPCTPKLNDYPVRVTGVHFHLDGYDASQRVSAITQSLRWIESLRQVGRNVRFLDVGGGFPMSYLDDGNQWDQFWSQHEQAMLDQRPAITYRQHGLGRYVHDSAVHGDPNSYPYFQTPTRSHWFAELLDTVVDERTIADQVRSHHLQLRCEPGRSLLDGCGMTVARVEFRKINADGDLLVGLSMNRTQCRTGSDDFLVDPILLPVSTDHQPAGEDVFHRSRSTASAGYFVGAYCTESELISLRKFSFSKGVAVGDLVVFPNTAGYLMHFLESRSHQFPLARNVVVHSLHEPTLDPIDVQASCRQSR